MSEGPIDNIELEEEPVDGANWISVISWKIPPLYVRDPQLWTGLRWNVGERFY
jgi:hypothetical protein